ncbi:MAG: hypothetical protein MJK14_20755 [Rivularia sp. ALOHA_DT_140]|nr:hypothetical protein [Rivularia sp. ALOHA_DT_140]
MILHSINTYLEFGSNSEIIDTLETACESIEVNTREYFYAQALLIEAYHSNEQFKDAVALSRQLVSSKHYLNRFTRNKYLSSLSGTQNLVRNLENLNIEEERNLLTATQASVIYQQGYDALINKDYDNAFTIFRKYCEDSLLGTREYLQAAQFLVNFYQQRGELDRATLLCTKLVKCNHKSSFRWAREVLYSDLFNENPPESIV